MYTPTDSRACPARHMARGALKILCGAALLGAGMVPGSGRAAPVLEQLADTPVSRLEWGMTRLRQGLVENFAQDPLTLAPSAPPYFINVALADDRSRIVLEIGQTFSSLDEMRARELCGEYVQRVRAFLSVDRSGRPAIKGRSSLAEDYFHPAFAPAPPELSFARALDDSVTIRGLVASPLNGTFSICGAPLTGAPVRYVD